MQLVRLMNLNNARKKVAAEKKIIIFHGLQRAHHQKNMIIKKILNYEYGISQNIYDDNHLTNLTFIYNEVICAKKTSML